MRGFAKHLRWPLAVLLVAHGAIHVLGFLWAFDLAELDQIGAATLLISDGVPGDAGMVAFGLLWLGTMLALVAAGIGVAREDAWGLPLAGLAAAISLVGRRPGRGGDQRGHPHLGSGCLSGWAGYQTRRESARSICESCRPTVGCLNPPLNLSA